MLKGLQLERPDSRARRLAWLGLLAVVAAFGFTAVDAGRAWAYQEEGEEAAAPADDAAAATDAASAGTEEAEAPAARRSYLMWIIEASGIFGLLIFLLSFLMVAVIMMNLLQVRRDNLLPPAFIETFEQKLAARDYQGAYEAARNDNSLVAKVLAAGLSRLNRGYNEAVEGMQEVGEDENMALEHRLSYLALIGTIGPMLGLMGTVYGMIMSFEQIANSATQPKPSELAGGISTALFTTLEGLMVAIPAMVFYSLLRNRVARYMLEVGMVSEGLMSRLSMAGKQQAQRPSAGGSAPATAPAAPKE